MRRQVLDDVALHAAADHAHVFLALDLEVEERRQEAALLQTLQQRVVVDVDGERFLVVAINDTGYVALATGLTGGPLACPRPYLGVEIGDFTGHERFSLGSSPPPSKGARRDRGPIAGNPPLGKPESVGACARRVGGGLAAGRAPVYLRTQHARGLRMSALSTLRAARPATAAFAAMGVVWGTYAAALPDIKAMLGVDESRLGLLMLFTPIAAVVAMLLAPAAGVALGRVALPTAAIAMAVVFAIPGQVDIVWLFPFAMMLCGAATGLTDVLMNARVAALENERNLHLMNLCHAAYSFGYAGGALGTGAMRNAAWSPGWVMGTMALVALLLALCTLERDGTIHGLRKPKDGTPGHLGLIPVIGGAIVLIAFMTENAAENWSALHIEKTLGGSPAEGAMGPAALALTMGFARLAGQGIAGRVDPYTLLRAAR